MAPPVASDLDRPPAVVLRPLCEALLGEAAVARSRLDADDDGEALHDLRVALRRLRTILGAYRSDLERAGAGKVRRRLRALAGATSDARDLEVQLGWLRGQQPPGTLPSPPAAEVDALLARLERRRARATVRAREAADAAFRPLRRQLSRRLAEDEEAALVSAGARSFGQAAAERILEQAAALQEAAGAVASARDEEPAHRARIAAKRLRYLVEPLRGTAIPEKNARAADALVKRLRALQDLLGQLHDAHVLGHVVEGAIQGAARGGPRIEEDRRAGEEAPPPVAHPSGLPALGARVAAERDRLYGQLVEARQQRAVEEISEAAEALAASLVAPALDLYVALDPDTLTPEQMAMLMDLGAAQVHRRRGTPEDLAFADELEARWAGVTPPGR